MGVCVCVRVCPLYKKLLNLFYLVIKGVLHLLPKINMFCALSQNNQLFEK